MFCPICLPEKGTRLHNKALGAFRHSLACDELGGCRSWVPTSPPMWYMPITCWPTLFDPTSLVSWPAPFWSKSSLLSTHVCNAHLHFLAYTLAVHISLLLFVVHALGSLACTSLAQASQMVACIFPVHASCLACAFLVSALLAIDAKLWLQDFVARRKLVIAAPGRHRLPKAVSSRTSPTSPYSNSISDMSACLNIGIMQLKDSFMWTMWMRLRVASPERRCFSNAASFRTSPASPCSNPS